MKPCLLCGRELKPYNNGLLGLQEHPDVADCLVKVTDAWGVSIELDPDGATPQPDSDDSDGVLLKRFPFVDEVLNETFDEFGLPVLGGESSGSGWSNISLFQKCPHAWRKRYLLNQRPALFTEADSLAIGSLVHAFLALHYSEMMPESPYNNITPEALHDRVIKKANPEFVNEAWRVYQAYRLYYQFEDIVPMAIEYDLKDPRTHESCRFDLISYHPTEAPGLLPGVYAWDHKTASRFDHQTLDGWANDGQMLGLVALWKRLGLDLRFGKLMGVIVNIIGKQREPRFHRTIVSPNQAQLSGHLDDLKRWSGLIQLAKSSNSFPRARAGCIGRYGMCSWWSECSSGKD